MPPTAPSPVKTARRREIVDRLRQMETQFRYLSGFDADAMREAILIIEGQGIPFDEIANLPTARRSDPDTSQAFKMTPDFKDMHFALLHVYVRNDYHGGNGMTPDEAAQALVMEPGPGPRKRVSELKRAGLIADTGERRPSALGRSAQVLAITEHGRREYDRVTGRRALDQVKP